MNSLGEGAVVPHQAAERISDFFTWLENLYRRNLEAAAAEGALCARADVQQLAAALVVFDQGLAIAARLPGQGGDLESAALALLACVSAR